MTRRNFAVAADDGIELAFLRHARQITAVLLERAVTTLSLGIGDALPAADILDGVGDAVAADAVFGHRIGHLGVALAEDGHEYVLGADVFIAQPIGFFVGAVDDAFQARRDEDLVRALAVNGRRARAAPQDVIHARTQGADIDGQPLEDLRHDAVGLLQQGQQEVLGVHLAVAVTVEDFVGAGGGVLRALGEAVELDHGCTFVVTVMSSLRFILMIRRYSDIRSSFRGISFGGSDKPANVYCFVENTFTLRCRLITLRK